MLNESLDLFHMEMQIRSKLKVKLKEISSEKEKNDYDKCCGLMILVLENLGFIYERTD